MRKSHTQGIATLPTVVVIGLVALAVVVSITAMTFNQLLISQAGAQSSAALFYAESGARDALTRIARNRTYMCSVADCYSVDFASGGCAASTNCAKVSVSAGVGTSADPKIIVSRGLMGASIRKMQASVLLDGGTSVGASQTGQITSVTWTEL